MVSFLKVALLHLTWISHFPFSTPDLQPRRTSSTTCASASFRSGFKAALEVNQSSSVDRAFAQTFWRGLSISLPVEKARV